MAASWLILAAATMIAQAPVGGDVAAAIAGLSAPRRADRDRAAARLEAIGEPARAALLEAAGSNDLELRATAAAALDRLDGGTLARPTTVALDFRDRPVHEVVDAIAGRTGLGLILDPSTPPQVATRKITLVAPGPVTYWEAVDRLGRAAGLRADAGPNGNPFGNAMPVFNNNAAVARPFPIRPFTGNEVVLSATGSGTGSEAMPAPPSVASGRFLVAVSELHHARDRILPGPGGKPPGIAVDRFEARLRVSPEPGLVIARVGEVRDLRAEDDLGQSLAPGGPEPEGAEANGGPAAAAMLRLGQGGMIRQGGDFQGGRSTAVAIRLRYPERPGGAIRRIAGVLPLAVVGSKPDPVVVPLDVVNRPATKGDATLTVHAVSPIAGPRFGGDLGDGEGTAPRLVELSVTRPTPPTLTPEVQDPNRFRGLGAGPAGTQGWFEFVDAAGQTLERYPVPVTQPDSSHRTIRIQRPAVAVRYLSPTWTTLDVPFELRDLPMP